MATPFKWASLLAALCLCLAVLPSAPALRVRRIVGGEPADEPPPEAAAPSPRPHSPTPDPALPPLVFVKKNRNSADVKGIANPDGSFSFLGLRYAEPPVGRLRFLRPKRRKLRGSIDASAFGPPCPQPHPSRDALVGSEDCLFLNVFTPQLPVGDGQPAPALPVLFWVHGGNFRRGSASQYVPTDLVKKGIVVVTVQYRLGSLGFLSLGRKELPGNVGLFDILAAQRWVRDYISFFGGNPKRIIAGGQGSGASCASMMALNPISKRYTRGVVAMSGSPVSPFALDESYKRSANEVAKADGCDNEEGLKFVRCMQDLPVGTILKGDNTVEKQRAMKDGYSKGLASILGPGPTKEGKEDGRFLPHFIVDQPLEAIQKKLILDIPIVLGVTKAETDSGLRGNFFQEISKKVLSPSFLTNGIFQDLLKSNTGLYVNNTVNSDLSKLFSNTEYLQFFAKPVQSILSDLQKVIKFTTDAFFNLPAFVTSHLWSKTGKVYLYSFEHTPKKSLAAQVLSGLPLVSGGDNLEKNGPSHGDDLMYLFDIRTLEGDSLPTVEMDNKDIKVKDHFTTMVAEFARNGRPKTNGTVWTPFSPSGGEYMAIKETPTVEKEFHKCDMGLWTGDSGILNSAECSFLGAAGKVVTDTIGLGGTSLLKTIDPLRSGYNGLSETLTSGLVDVPRPPIPAQPLPLGGLLNLQPTTKKPPLASTTKKAGSLFGGVGTSLFGG